jgi:hypothetical protein
MSEIVAIFTDVHQGTGELIAASDDPALVARVAEMFAGAETARGPKPCRALLRVLRAESRAPKQAR